MNLKLVFAPIFLYVVWTGEAVAGGYDACIDYPVNYRVWAIFLSIIFILSLLIASKIKLFKKYPVLISSLLLTLVLFAVLVNISYVKDHLEHDYQQKFNCLFSSVDASSTSEQSPEAVKAPEEPKIYLRDELEGLVRNKKQEEVLSILGTPYSTSKSSDTEYWYYHEKTIDPVTQKTDYSLQLVFELAEGYMVVSSINFN